MKHTTTARPTEGPWEYDGTVIRKNGMIVCRMLDLGFPSHGSKDANAELIVKAVNSFPALLAALKELVEESYGEDSNGLRMARAALQQVEDSCKQI